jgi:hypothetical protein
LQIQNYKQTEASIFSSLAIKGILKIKEKAFCKLVTEGFYKESSLQH